MNRRSPDTTCLFLLLLFCSNVLVSSAQDIVRMTAQNIYSKQLQEVTHFYPVYDKIGEDASSSKMQFRARTIKRKHHQGLPDILISDQWEYSDSFVHTATVICDAETLTLILHELWCSGTPVVEVDFQTRKLKVNNATNQAGDTTPSCKAIWTIANTSASNYILRSHIDLELFPPLSLNMGLAVIIPFYDPQTGASPEEEVYTVTGEEPISSYDNQQIDCCLIGKTGFGNNQLYRISKKQMKYSLTNSR